MYHTCYFYISVNFPGKDLLGQYISDFYREKEKLDQKTMKNCHQKLHALVKRGSSLCFEGVSS